MFGKELRTIRVKGGVVSNSERESIVRLVLFMAGANNVKTLDVYNQDGEAELIIVAKMRHNTWLNLFWEMSQAHADTCLFDM